MKKRAFFVSILILFVGVFFVAFYFYSDVRGELVNPLVSSGPHGSEVVDNTESDIPVSCVLTYGTFMVNQQSCDELTEFEASSAGDVASIQCEVPAGTFLVSERECEILKDAKGSQDVMGQLD